MTSKFVFLYVGSLMCQSVNLSRFKMLVVFSPIFVVDTEIIFGYDFRASLNTPLIEITALEQLL